MHKPIVYGSIISPFVRKVVITLNIKKIDFELTPLNPFVEKDKQFLLTLNPLGKVPVYKENDFVISDSSVICAYLDKAFPKNSIFPKNTHAYAKSLWWEEVVDTQLLPSINILFFNTVLSPLLKIPPNKELVATTLTVTLPKIFEYLNQAMEDSPFLVGQELSIADIALGQLALVKSNFLDLPITLSKWSRLDAYISKIAQNPFFNEVFTAARERLQKIKEFTP